MPSKNLACTFRGLFGGIGIVLGLFASTLASAGALLFTDTTVGGAVWNRPLAGNPPTLLSGVGTAVAFDVTRLQVTASGSYSFLSTGVSPVLWDNYSFLYQNSFNSASPFANVLVGSDDFQSVGLSGFTINLLSGVDYFLVESGFSNSDQGIYKVEITSQSGDAFVVSEPESLALFGLGLLGVAALRRRKIQGKTQAG